MFLFKFIFLLFIVLFIFILLTAFRFINTFRNNINIFKEDEGEYVDYEEEK